MSVDGGEQLQIDVVAVVRPGESEAALIAFSKDVRAWADGHLHDICLYDATGQDRDAMALEEAGVRARRGYWDEDLGRARNDALSMSTAEWALVLSIHDRPVGDVRALCMQLAAVAADGADVGIVDVIEGRDRPRCGRLLRHDSVRYTGSESEIIHSSLRSDRQCVLVPPDVLHLQGDQRVTEGEKGARRPRRLARLMRDLDLVGDHGVHGVSKLQVELGRELQLLGDFTAAQRCYRHAAEGDAGDPWVWAARESWTDLLISQGELAAADVQLGGLEGGPNPVFAHWLRVSWHLASGDARSALELLGRQNPPKATLGAQISEEAVLRKRFRIAQEAGNSHELLVSLLALMVAGLDIEGRGPLLMLLWGGRSPRDLAEIVVDTESPHLEAIADELSGSGRAGSQVAREVRRRKRRYSVAAVVIARDEARCIERCLASVLPWVDEVVVADTGSVDGTAALAKAAGARVVHVPWADDFAAARNAALEAAGADWHVIIDADETIAGGGRELQDLHGVSPGRVMAVSVVSSFRLAGEIEVESEIQSRILPGHVRYEGIVHASPRHKLPVTQVRVTIEHDGYEPEQLAEKLPRRERLLRKALLADSEDAYIRYQLGRNLETQGRLPEAIEEYDKIDVRSLTPEGWHHILVVQHAHTLTSVGRGQDALALLTSQAGRFDASSDYHFVLGNVLLDLAVGEPSMVADLLPLAAAEFRRCLEIGEHDQFTGHVSGRGSHLAQRNLEIVAAGCRDLDIRLADAAQMDVETPDEDNHRVDGVSDARLPDGSLDVVMIVKNEEARLGPALASCAALRPLLGEICVYDTGSTDGTRELARSHGARVTDGFWDEDYSRARNAAAAMSDAPWLLVLDADECVVGDPERLAAELAQGDVRGDETLYTEVTVVNGEAREPGAVKTWMSARLYRPDLARYARPVHAELRRRDGSRFTGERHIAREALRIDNAGFDADRQRASVQRALHLTDVAQGVRADQNDRHAVYVDRARARWGAGDADGAREDLKAAIQLGSGTTYHRWAFQWLIRLELKAGRLDAAGEQLDHLKAMAPTDSYTRWLDAHLRLARGFAQEASDILSRIDEVTDAIGLLLPAELVAQAALTAARTASDDVATARGVAKLAKARGESELAARAQGLVVQLLQGQGATRMSSVTGPENWNEEPQVES